jgi:hypothetical protein
MHRVALRSRFLLLLQKPEHVVFFFFLEKTLLTICKGTQRRSGYLSPRARVSRNVQADCIAALEYVAHQTVRKSNLVAPLDNFS